MDTNLASLTWGAAIKTARQDLGLSRAQLAIDVGVTASMVGMWETGKHAPSPRAQAVLRERLGLDLNAIADAIRKAAA